MHIAVERVVNASGHVFEAGQVFLCERFRVHIVLRCFDFRARYERRISRNELPALPLPFALQIFVLTDSPQLVELGEAFWRTDDQRTATGRGQCRTQYLVPGVRLHILKFIEHHEVQCHTTKRIGLIRTFQRDFRAVLQHDGHRGVVFLTNPFTRQNFLQVIPQDLASHLVSRCDVPDTLLFLFGCRADDGGDRQPGFTPASTRTHHFETMWRLEDLHLPRMQLYETQRRRDGHS